jgi:Tfp pilus assembly protein PilN
MSQQINLYNGSLLKRRSVLSAANMLIVLVLSIVVLMIALTIVRMQTTDMKKSSEQSSLQLKKLSDQALILRNSQAPKLKNQALELELRTIEATLLRRHQIAQILQNSEFGNTEGYSAYLTAFACQIPANVWLTGFNLEGAGYDLVLYGRTLQAELVPQYVSKLKQEKIMQGKSFSALQVERPLLPLPATVSAADPKKTAEPAPYLEFQLHSSEQKEKMQSDGVKLQ